MGGSNSGKILLVEDNNDLRLCYHHQLSMEGFDVTEAENGQAAWHKLQSGLRPVAIVTDLRMPQMNGFRLIANLHHHEVLHRIPFIIISGEIMLSDIAAAVGAAGYVTKGSPVDLVPILTSVRLTF